MNNSPLYPVETEALIKAVEKRPPLWDRFDKLYTHRFYIRKLWKEVAKEVNQSEEILRKRWKGCKDTYRKKLKKVQSEGYGSSDDTKWPFYHLMGFLGNNINYKNQQLEGTLNSNGDHFATFEMLLSSEGQNCSYNEIAANGIDSGDGDDHHQCEETSYPNYILEPECDVNEEETQLSLPNEPEQEPQTKRKKRKRRRSDSNNSEIIKLEQRKLELIKKLTDDECDDNYQFLMSLLNPMRKMNTTSNMWFRLKVQELLYSTVTEQR